MKTGDKVRFINAKQHMDYPEHYPSVGTIGAVIKVDNMGAQVQWTEGSTSGDDRWRVCTGALELVEEAKRVKKYKVTLCNGKYPLTRECDDIYEALKTLDAMNGVQGCNISMSLAMNRLVNMQNGECLSFAANGYRVELVEEAEE